MSWISFALAIASMAVVSVAQGQARPTPDSSSGKQIDARAVAYESAFKGYRKLEDQPVTSWRDANDLVHRLGGWKAFAGGKVPGDSESSSRPAQSPDKAQPAQPPPATAGGHTGHKTK